MNQIDKVQESNGETPPPITPSGEGAISSTEGFVYLTLDATAVWMVD